MAAFLRSTGSPVCLALAFCLLMPAAAAAAPAVVFVSGLSSVTSFTNATPECAGKEGDTWNSPDGPPAAVRAAGRQVFTAPAGEGAKAPAPCGTPAPPASVTIDSGGDADANGAALQNFLAFLKAEYGVTQVQLVAHSDGGIWSRAAITQSAGGSGPEILSLTTLGTPHTGAWTADLAVGSASLDCTSFACKVLKALATEELGNLGQTAVKELTSTYTIDWNKDQAIGACPVTTIAGTYLQLSYLDMPAYYLPADGLVGRASAHAVKSQSYTGSDIPAPSIPNLANGGDYPVVHSPAVSFLGTSATLINDAGISAQVLSILGAATGATCTPSAGAEGQATAKPGSGPGSTHRTEVDLVRPVGLASGDPRSTRFADAIVHEADTTMSCRGTPIPPAGAFGSRLSISLPGACEALVADGPAVIHRSARDAQATLRRSGRTLRVRASGLRGLRVHARGDNGWQSLRKRGRRLILPRHEGDLVHLRLVGRAKQGGRRHGTAVLQN